MQSWTFGLILVALLCASGCRSADRTDTNHKTWMTPKANPVLVAGVKVRSWYYTNICPGNGESYVVNRDGSFVRTLDELKRVIQPLDTPERALAYCRLLRRIELERGEDLPALIHSRPLRFHEGEAASWGVFVAADATRWGVGQEPLIESTVEGTMITQPFFRQTGSYEAGGPDWWKNGAFVELVRETIQRDGGYRREVLRVLERGETALVHKPAPLL